MSTKRTAALPWRGPDHCSRTCHPSAHPRTCYPSAHPRMCVLSKSTVKLVLQASSLLTSSHSGQACHVFSCTSRAPSASLVPLSCTIHKLPQLSWHLLLPGRWNFYSCTTVHHSAISCTTPQSRAPLRNPVHLSCTTCTTRTTLVHCSPAPLTSFLNCRGTSRCLADGSPTQEASSTLVHHSNTHNSHC